MISQLLLQQELQQMNNSVIHLLQIPEMNIHKTQATTALRFISKDAVGAKMSSRAVRFLKPVVSKSLLMTPFMPTPYPTTRHAMIHLQIKIGSEIWKQNLELTCCLCI